MKIQGQKKAAFALEVSIATVSDYVGRREGKGHCNNQRKVKK